MADRLLTRTPSKIRLAGRRALRAIGLHPDDPQAAVLDLTGTRALCVATNRAVLDIGVPTGVFGSELTVPYYAFLDNGMAVNVASPHGGIIPVDPLSMKSEIRTSADDRLVGDEVLRHSLMASPAVADLDFTAHDIVYFAGGWGASFDFAQSAVLGERVSEAYAAGRVLGGICHGPLGLLGGRTPAGRPIVEGRRVTAVTDRQVRQLGITITPLHPETELRKAGAIFEGRTHPVRDFFANYYIADGDLITGQNQNAGPMVARLMMERVLAKRATPERSAR